MTMKRRRSMRRTEVVITITGVLVKIRFGVSMSVVDGMRVGNDLGSGPKSNWPPNSRNNEMPIAVIKIVIFGLNLSGLYASFSMVTPSVEQTIIESRRTIGPTRKRLPPTRGAIRGAA